MNHSQVRLALSPSSQASSSNNEPLVGGASNQVASPELHEQLLLSVDHNNHDLSQQQPKKNLKTEYKSKFTPFDQYVYDEASDKFIKPPSSFNSNFNLNSNSSRSPVLSPRPHHLPHDLISPTSDLASINSQAGDPWYREVVKRNEKANEYRFKSEVGHHSPLLGLSHGEPPAGGCLSPSDHQPAAGDAGISHPPTPTHPGEGGPRFTPNDYRRDHLIAHMANNNNFALPRDEAPLASSSRRTQQATGRATAHARSRSQSSRRVPAAATTTTASNNTSTTAKQLAATSKSHQTTPTRAPRTPLVSARPVAGREPAAKTAAPTTAPTAPRPSRPASASASAAKRTPSATAPRTTPRSLATTNASSPATRTTPSNSRTTASRAPSRATPTTTHPRPAAIGHQASTASKSTTSTLNSATRAAGLAAGRLPNTSVKAPAKLAAASKTSNNLASSSPRASLTGAASSFGAEQKSGVKSIKTPALSQAKEVSAAEATMAVAAMGATGVVLGAIVQDPEAGPKEVVPVEVVEQPQAEEEPTNLIFTTTEAGNMLADELAQAAQKEALELEEAGLQQVEVKPQMEMDKAKVDEEPAPVAMLQVSLEDFGSSDSAKTELINGLATGGLVSAEDRFDSSERETSSLADKDSLKNVQDHEDEEEEENEEPYSIMPRGEPVQDDFKGDEFNVELRSRHDLGHTWTERQDFERERETSPPSRDVSFPEKEEEEDLTKVKTEPEAPLEQVIEEVIQPSEDHGQLMFGATEIQINENDNLTQKQIEEHDSSASSSPDSQLAAPQHGAVVVEEQVEDTNDTNEMKYVMESNMVELGDQPSPPSDQNEVEPLAGAKQQEQEHIVEEIESETVTEQEETTREPSVGISVEVVDEAGEISGDEEPMGSPLAKLQEDEAGQQETIAAGDEMSASETWTSKGEEVALDGVQEQDLVQEALFRPEETSAPLESNSEAQEALMGSTEPETNQGLGSGATIISSGSSESSISSDAEEEEEEESKRQAEEERSNKSELLMNIVDLIDGEERRKQEMARKSEVARKGSSPLSPTMLAGEEVLLAPGQLIMEQFDLISGASNNSSAANESAAVHENEHAERQQQPNNDNNNTVESSDMREKVNIENLVESAASQDLINGSNVGEQKEDSGNSLDSIGQDKGGSLSSLEGIEDGRRTPRRPSDQLSSKATDDQQAELDQFGSGAENHAIDLTEEEELKLSNRLTNSEDELILAPRNYDNPDELSKAEQLDLLAREDRLDGQLELGDGSSAELETAPSAAETLVEMASTKGSPELAMRHDLFGSSKQSNLMFAHDDDDDAAIRSQPTEQLLLFDNDLKPDNESSGGKISHDMGPIGGAPEAPQVEPAASDLHNSN